MVGMYQEQHVKRFLQHWIRYIIFLAKMIHLVQKAVWSVEDVTDNVSSC